MPFAFILYAVGLLTFNALINFVAGIPIVFYEMAAISGNPRSYYRCVVSRCNVTGDGVAILARGAGTVLLPGLSGGYPQC